MAWLNMTAASEALKINYLPALRYQLNTANPILSVIDRNSESVVGSEIRMALRYGRQGGVGNRAEDGTLPIPNSRKTKQAKFDTKNLFARIQISDKTMKASRSRDGAFVSLLEAELEDAQTDAKDAMARQCFGDGTGKLATFSAATTQNTFTVSSTQYFVEGMFIDVMDNTNAVKVTQREVVAVDDIAGTITLSGAAFTTVATDYAVVFGNYGQELTGFASVFNVNNTIYGIDRSTNKWFNPTVKGTVGAISEVGIQQMIDDVDRKAGGKTNFLLSSYGVRRAYQDLLLATKRTTDVMTLKGGYETLTFNGMPFAVDKYAPSGTLYGLDLSTWALYHIEDWDWLNEDGAVLHRVADRPVWEASLVRYCDLGCSKPKGNFVMTGVTEK
jgi:hypothetical protein